MVLLQTPTIDPLHRSLLTKLIQYQLLPHLIKELIIDNAITSVPLSQSASKLAIHNFCQTQGMNSVETRESWLNHFHMSIEQLENQAVRLAKLEKFKAEQWGACIEPLFLAQKQYLDQVTYSILRTKSADIAQELYFRLKEGEQGFSDLAIEYSRDPKLQVVEFVGPIDVGRLRPALRQILMRTRLGKVHAPIKLDGWTVIIRLEQIISAVLDKTMRQRLLDRLFNEWMQQQLVAFDCSFLEHLQ
jgi:hypothetical protein